MASTAECNLTAIKNQKTLSLKTLLLTMSPTPHKSDSLCEPQGKQDGNSLSPRLIHPLFALFENFSVGCWAWALAMHLARHLLHDLCHLLRTLVWALSGLAQNSV